MPDLRGLEGVGRTPARLPPISGILVLVAVAAAGLSRPAFAFDSKGHNVIEALAYRTLVEGYGGSLPVPRFFAT